MRSKFFPILLLFTMVCSQKKGDTLKTEILAELGKTKGTFAIAIKDLQTGGQILINGDSIFHAASTMKVPVLIEVFKQAGEGKFTLQDSIEIINEFKSIVDSSSYSLTAESDSDTSIYKHIGERRSIHSLAFDMTTISSNLSTNILIGKMGAQRVQETIQRLGTTKMRVLRGLEDSKAFEAGLNNTTTAHDLMVLFEKLAKGEVVDAPSSKGMIEILLAQKFHTIIPGQLPGNVKVAHKTGSITGVRHDAGIVFLPDGRKYVIVLLSKNLEDEKAGVETLSRASKIVYDWMIRD